VMEYSPCAFVAVPVCVPFTITDTPTAGLLWSSVTFPVIVLGCLYVNAKQTMQSNKLIEIKYFIQLFYGDEKK